MILFKRIYHLTRLPKPILASVAVFAFTIMYVLSPLLAHASFNANNLMDDAVFDNANSMNSSQIDSWLNSNFPSSCISTNNGFSTPDVLGYSPSTGYRYGANVSVGTVINHISQAYNINPQVLLTTLQKEQSLVSGSKGCQKNSPDPSATVRTTTACTEVQSDTPPDQITSSICTNACVYSGGCLNIAIGNDCPYYCKATSEGFSKQLISGAWKLKYWEQRSEGNINWNVQKPGWDNSDDPPSCYTGAMTQGYRARSASSSACPYNGAPGTQVAYYDGYTTINGGGTSVHLDNGATAALYRFTPFTSGNNSFDTIFTGWFGGLYASPYSAAYYSQSAYPQLNPGQQTTSFFSYQNVGNQTWYDDISIGSAPSGSYPVHLATSHVLNRSSAFAAGWPNAARPAVNFSAVYESDGTTLASNQHVAQPGQIVKFSFTMTAPASGLASNTYPEYFMPVAEGSATGLFNDPGTALLTTVKAP